MNRIHRRYCRSARWRRAVSRSIVPPAIAGLDLGDKVLEVGPGPGLTTDLLRSLVPALTAIELDEHLAGALRRRLAGTNVQVFQGDATAMPFADSTFSAAVCFTMLHHVPSADLQDRLLSEMCRVLRPGGILAGSDTLGGTWFCRLIHIGDTMVLVDPGTLPQRLSAAGFTDIVVARGGRLRFHGRRKA